MRKTVTIPRQELFDRVWSTPLLKLAREIGVSDAAVGKACRRVGIPLPGRGHWSKPGKTGKPKLPAAKDPAHERVAFNVLDPDYQPPKLPERPGTILPPVLVAAALERPHALVRSVRDAAKRAPVDKGRVFLRGTGLLHVSVSPAMLDRALRIFDAVVKAAEAQGHMWISAKEGKAALLCAGTEVPIKLGELLTWQQAKAQAVRRSSLPPGVWESAYRPHEYRELVSTGKLYLEVGQETSIHTTKRVWRDTSSGRLEDKLSDLLAEAPRIAAGIAAAKQRWEEERLFSARQEQVREESRQHDLRIAAKRQRLTGGLGAAAAGYSEATRLRQLCDALEVRLQRLSGPSRRKARRVVELGRAEADRLDPLVEGLVALLELEDEFPGEEG